VKEEQSLREKIQDYKNFSNILVAAAAFFYFGLVLVGSDKSQAQLILVLVTSYLFIAIAFLFRMVAIKDMRKLQDIEK